MTRREEALQELDRRHVFGAWKQTDDGVKVEHRLADDGSTWERRSSSHPGLHLISEWHRTRKSFSTVEQWRKSHENWTFTMTPEQRLANAKRTLILGLFCLPFLLYYGFYLVKFLVLCIIVFAIGIPLMILGHIFGRSPYRRYR
ncbi:MAG TPA: hypothetical protein VHM88_23455 [Candidatus Acidoferrales bacterium]|nr:hypothetical protein [Candidatus Acidoferrales bacterium]